jgi:hypothetical protein
MVDQRIILQQWLRSNCFKVIVISVCLIGVYFYYNSGSNSNFSKESSKIYGNSSVIKERTKEPELKNENSHTKISSGHFHFQEKIFDSENHLENDVNTQGIDVLLLFSKARTNWPLRNKFSMMVQSLLDTSSVPLRLHVIGDEESQEIAKQTIQGFKASDTKPYNYTVRLILFCFLNLTYILYFRVFLPVKVTRCNPTIQFPFSNTQASGCICYLCIKIQLPSPGVKIRNSMI